MQLVIIGVPDLTQESNPYMALEAWKAGGLIERIAPHVSYAAWATVPEPAVSVPGDRHLLEMANYISKTVQIVETAGAFPLVIGGTRLLSSLGTVAGLRHMEPGVVWLDARDAFASIDGLEAPLSCLTGTAMAGALASIQNSIPVKDWHTLLLGVRQPTTAAERQTTVWTAQDLTEAGTDELGSDMGNWPPVYLHLDLSVLDPALMPAVDHPLPAGLALETVTAAVEAIAANARVAAMGVTGYRPQNDPDGIGLTVGLELLEAAIRILAI